MNEKIAYQKPRPTLSIDSEDFPEIKDWQVGEKYTINATVKMTFQSEGDEYDSMPIGVNGEKKKSPMRARFKILSISETGKKKGKMIPRVKSK